MYTISELVKSKVLIPIDDELPFIIETARFTSITGNAFGTYSFEVLNSDEVYLHLANPLIIPDENLGKIKVICSNNSTSSHSCTISLPSKAYVISKDRYFEEKVSGSFASVEAWLALEAKLEAEAEATNPAPNEGHPKLNPAEFL